MNSNTLLGFIAGYFTGFIVLALFVLTVLKWLKRDDEHLNTWDELLAEVRHEELLERKARQN